MATINKHRSKWRCQVRRKGYPAQIKSFDIKADAIKWGREIEVKMDGLAFTPVALARITTFGDLLSKYMDEIAPTKRSEHTMKGLATTLRKYFGAYAVTSITSAQLAEYRNARLQVRSAQTVVHELNMLNRVLKLATTEWGIALPAGIPRVIKPKKPTGRIRRVTPDEEKALIEAAKDSPELPSIIQLAILTAMRRAELVTMRKEHVDLARRTAHIPLTKTDTPRTVPLASKAVELLRPRVTQGGHGPVFAITPDSVTQAFNRAVVRARKAYLTECATRQAKPDPGYLVDLRFHDLRHEGISRLVERGLNLLEVSAVSGHKTMQMLKRYTHLRAEDIALKLG